MASRVTHNFTSAGADSGNSAIATILAAQLQADGVARAAMAQAQGNIGAAREAARGAAGAAAGGSYNQGLSGLGNAYSGAYGAYAGGLSNIAQAMANERSNLYGANAMAEAARQAAAGNIGSSALGAAGSGLSSALGAWGANQAAYNQALSAMQSANQLGLSQLGQSRNTALGQLANPYSSLGRGMIAADIAGDLVGALGGGGGGMGGGFMASGIGGPVASGSYASGVSRPSSSRSSRTNSGASALQGLGDLRGSIMNPDVMNQMVAGNASAMRDLNDQHYSSRLMPMQMFSDGMGSVRGLAAQAYSQLGRGMDQFYQTNTNTANRSDFSGILTALASGYGNANSSIGTLPSWMRPDPPPGSSTFNNLPEISVQVPAGQDFSSYLFRNSAPVSRKW